MGMHSTASYATTDCAVHDSPILTALPPRLFFFWLLPPQQLEPGQVEAPFRVQALRVHAQCLAEWPPQVPSVPKT